MGVLETLQYQRRVGEGWGIAKGVATIPPGRDKEGEVGNSRWKDALPARISAGRLALYCCFHLDFDGDTHHVTA